MLKSLDCIRMLTVEVTLPSTMAANLPSYTAAEFNSIPDIVDSAKGFEEANTSGLLLQEIGQALLKHQVNSSLGLTLVHRHFDLAQ